MSLNIRGVQIANGSKNPDDEQSMAGALLMRARDGSGLAWLPESLIEADLERKTLVRTGSDSWTVALDIRLHRNKKNSNHLTRSIWSFLKTE